MTQHVTLTLPNGDDFEALLDIILNSGYPLLNFDDQKWEVEAYIDELIMCIAERYLYAAVLTHARIKRPMYSNYNEELNAVA